MAYPGTYTDQILKKSGISEPSTAQIQLAYTFSTYIEQGTMDLSGAVEEYRVQMGQLPRGEYGLEPYTGGLNPTINGDDTQVDEEIAVPELVNILTPILGAQGALQLVLTDPEAAFNMARKLLSGGIEGTGSGGSAGRTQFESESRLQNAQASQIEQEIARAGMGGSRLVNIGGVMYDPDTGQAIDPSTYGVASRNADTSRFGAETDRQLADFRTGPEFQETIRQFDQKLGLDAMGEERLSKSAAADAEIGFGNLGVDRAKFIQSILSQPSDTLARLYAQRGGTSPLAKIEMADLLNSFNRQASNISASASRFMPSSTIKPATGVAPTKLPTPTAIAPTSGSGSGNYNYLSPQGDPYSPEAQARWGQGIDEGSIKVVTEDPSSYGAIETNANNMFTPDAGGQDYRFEVNDEGTLVPIPMAKGGYTRESHFIVGDQRSGVPTGNEELVVNPTNAPIQVVPNKALGGMSRFANGKVARYDEGTGSFGPERTLDLEKPNAFKEALQGFLEWQKGNRSKVEPVLDKASMGNPGARAAMNDAPNAAMIGPSMSRFDMKNIPVDWSPEDYRKFSQNLKMDNLKSLKSMYDNALERASRLDKLAQNAEGNKGMRLSRLADRAFKRVDDLFSYERELQNEILHNARQKSYQEVDFIEPGKPGQGLREALGGDVPSYAEGTLFPSYNDSHSLFPTGDVSQSDLIGMSRLGTGPGGTSVLSGSMPDRFRIPGLPTPTAMQFNALSGAERENLRPRLAAEFNSTLEDLMFDIEQRYSTGPSRMAKFRG